MSDSRLENPVSGPPRDRQLLLETTQEHALIGINDTVVEYFRDGAAVDLPGNVLVYGGRGFGGDAEQPLKMREIGELLIAQMAVFEAVGEVVAVEPLEPAGERSCQRGAMVIADPHDLLATYIPHARSTGQQVVDFHDGILARPPPQQTLRNGRPDGGQGNERSAGRHGAILRVGGQRTATGVVNV